MAAVICSFLLGFLSLFKITIIGSLSWNELLLIALLPVYLLPMLQALSLPAIRRIFTLGVLYLCSQMASDWYRGIAQVDYLRGSAKIAVTLTSMLLFTVLIKRSKHAILALVLGGCVAAVVYGVALQVDYSGKDIYKFYIGNVVTICAFAAPCFFFRSRNAIAIFPAVAGLVAFLMDSRSLGGLTLLAVAANWLGFTIDRGEVKILLFRQSAGWRPLVIMGALAIAGIGLFEAYRLVAERGMLGRDAQDKYEDQRNFRGRDSFSIFSGRTEVFFAAPKIIESPLIGWGSWAKDWNYVYGRAEELGLNATAVAEASAKGEPGLIPTHSHIFGGWLEAGLLGGVFWIAVCWRAVLAFTRDRVAASGRMGPLMMYLLLTFLWDLLFSPYGGDRRVWDGAFIAWVALGEALSSGSYNVLKRTTAGGHFTAAPSVNSVLNHPRRAKAT